MEDRSNIIKEAIEYRDKLEKKVEELAQSIVRLQISLDFADNTIKKKDKENAELKAYKDVNEDFKTAWEELKAENERLKEEIIHQRKLNQELIIKYIKPITVPTLNTELFDENYKLKQTLQEIKELVEKECKDCSNKRTDSCWICPYYPILNIITKAESEG